MVDLLHALDRFAWVLLLFGIVVATGTYRGNQASESYPVIGGAMVLAAVAIAVFAYVQKDDQADAAAE